MLLAAVSIAGPAALKRLLDRSLGGGTPLTVLLRREDGLVLGTAHDARVVVDEDRGSNIEGYAGPLRQGTPEDIVAARGDFALVRLLPGGMTLGSAMADGYRPLYVSPLSDATAIASTHLNPLLALLPKRPRLDVDFLASGLGYLPGRPHLDPSRTPYIGVQQVPMGETWRISPGRAPERHKTLRAPQEKEMRASDTERTLLFRDALASALRRALAGQTERLWPLAADSTLARSWLLLASYPARGAFTPVRRRSPSDSTHPRRATTARTAARSRSGWEWRFKTSPRPRVHHSFATCSSWMAGPVAPLPRPFGPAWQD